MDPTVDDLETVVKMLVTSKIEMKVVDQLRFEGLRVCRFRDGILEERNEG